MVSQLALGIKPGSRSLVLCALLTGSFLSVPLASAQQIHRNGFEGRDTGWVKGAADVAFRESKHGTTDQLAHGGLRSETIQLTAEQGSFIYYQYAIGRALINDDLTISVWVKANRPGIQVLARLVLPHERNTNLEDTLTVVIRGDRLKAAGHWERLQLRRPSDLVKQQQVVMQGSLKRPINIKDAYIDQVLINAYTGPGLAEIWLDDLEAGPIVDPAAPLHAADGPTRGRPQGVLASQRKTGRSVSVEHMQGELLVDKKRFFMRGIRYSNTPLKTLREAAFNTLWVDYAASPMLLQEAVDLGFWLVPTLPVSAEDKRMVSADTLSRDVSRFLTGDAVLFWDQGGALTVEQVGTVAQAAQMIRSIDPGRPIGGDVWDGFMPYSRALDLVGAHRWPLMTTLELPKYRDWLNQRRLLANPGTYMWTWVQTHLPDWYLLQVYGRTDVSGIADPIGPQPEQIRLLTYTALAAGSRGLGFWSDRFLADSHQGRDRLQVLALINQELEMLEPILTTVDDPPIWIDTSVKEIKAAVLRSRRGILVLPIWIGAGAQMVPGQAAASQLSMVVPQVPQGTQAWEVTPGQVHSHLTPKRVPGGWKITIPEFGLTTAVVFTSDISLIVRFQEQARSKCKLAAQWTRDLAALELAKAFRVEQQLEREGHSLPDGKKLIDNAQKRLRQCEEHWTNHLYTEAYMEGQRALRPIRILMRAQWDQALKGQDTPVATPFLVSFYTLPRHWDMMREIGAMKPAANVLTEGGFETDPARAMAGWVLQDPTLDEVTMTARRVKEVIVETPVPKAPKPKSPAGGAPATRAPMAPGPAFTVSVEAPKEGKQCLLLEIRPKDPLYPPAALQRTFLGVHSPAVKLPPGSLVQISAWVRIPKAINASADGALIYDSAGGEPLAIRLTDATPWKRFLVYRKVPASGQLHVTVALTGIGKAYFDDIRIEPLVGAPSGAPVGPVAARK